MACVRWRAQLKKKLSSRQPRGVCSRRSRPLSASRVRLLTRVRDKTSKGATHGPPPFALVVLPAVAGCGSGSNLHEKLVDVVGADDVGELDLPAAHHVDDIVGARIGRGKILELIPDLILHPVADPFQYLRDEPCGLVVELSLLLLAELVAELLTLLALLLARCGH
jgi:hypothetical protein